METKQCTSCNMVLSIDWFGPHKKQYNGIAKMYVKSQCKTCLARKSKERLERDPIARKNNLERSLLRFRSSIRGKIQCYIAMWRKKTPGSDLTVEYLVDLWNKQNGKCYYTGLDMNWRSKGITSVSLSLDRLIPEKGYVIGNVAWCCYFINTMKGGHTEEDFYTRMRSILVYRGR